jgi:transcriptional regulator with XRE-family HTH domain
MMAIWKKMKNKEYRDSFVAAQISNTISAQIHTMRQTRGWTQSDLASRCDMRQSRISDLEDPELQNVEIATLRRIASAFDVALIVRFARFSEVARLSASMKSSDFNATEYSYDSLDTTAPVRSKIKVVYNVSTFSGGTFSCLSQIGSIHGIQTDVLGSFPGYAAPPISIAPSRASDEAVCQLH